MSVEALYPTIDPSLLLDFASTRALDPRITFTRASTGRFYNGVTTAKAEENLFTYSQDFSQWTQPSGQCGVTVDATTAPDGTTTADLLVTDTSSATYRVRQNPVAVSFTGTAILSVYVKANGYNFMSVVLTGSYGRATLDFTTSSITNYGTNNLTLVSSTLNNGWYRVVLSLPVSASSVNVWIGPNSAIRDPASGAWAGDGTSGIYIWGAQLEQRSAVTAYTVTTTQPVTNYIPVLLTAQAGQARFNHNPITGESLGLLIEEQRTNLLTYSEDFSNAAWGKTQGTITSNTVVAPDGTLTGDKFVESTAASVQHFVIQSPSTTLNTIYVSSIYAKAGERTRIQLFAYGTATIITTFDLSTGTVVGGTGTITAVGNGWYRCAISFSGEATSTLQGIFLVSTGTTNSYTGDGWSGAYIWGAQVEAASFATSYIPTVASQVTRSADGASIQNVSSFINQAECTVYTENLPLSTIFPPNNFPIPWQLLDPRGATALFQYGQGQAIELYLGATYNNLGTSSIASPKIAVAASVNAQGGAALNGVVGDRSGNLRGSITSFNIGSAGGTSNFFNGTIKKIAYYPERLTNTQIQAITT